jgi:flagellin
MTSILTNPSALSALQALQMTQQEMQQTQNQVSTGLAVASAADNAAYWSIATQLNSNSGVVTAANQALTQSQSVMDTASSAINSIITTISSIQTALTQATNPGADLANINTTLAGLSQQLTQAVSGASFNGLNVLDGSQAGAALNFVSGFNESSTGVGTITSISFTTAALIDTANPTFGILQGGTGTAAGTAGAAGPPATAGNGNGFGGANPLDLTTLGTAGVVANAAQASTMLTQVAQTLAEVTNYSATIGSAQDQMTAASTFNSALTTNYAEGVSGLVDANMNTASTRLQALQTQEQLGIQSLSIANQNAQLILKLFP